LLFGVASPASALPTLQLDIAGGYYDPVTETIVTTADSFTLFAYLSFDGTNGNGSPTGRTKEELLATDYYISVALTPKIGPTDSSVGSFDFDGDTVNATTDMTYGTPPIETAHTGPDIDLAPHSIYETFYEQYQFNFTDDLAHRTTPYNTQTAAGSAPGTPWTSGPYMLFQSFDVDKLLLSDDYQLHFDLYSTKLVDGPGPHPDDLQVDLFAPFSHDAESVVPEPGTLMLLGSGLFGLGAWRRRQGKGRE
jgi:hypothetical protein